MTAKKIPAGKTEEPVVATDDALQIALLMARTADDRQADDILVLHVSELTVIADYMVIMSGRNVPHLRAVTEELVKLSKKRKLHLLGTEGADTIPSGDHKWAILDLGSVIVHIFDADTRTYYDLELLWGDAPKIDWKA
ncbi:MAG TPA: ribosome silencing factor [Candidatus Brocadiia bacterium]|nr:ribosome silencing factor [Candidatus Brocadiia bacterium]